MSMNQPPMPGGPPQGQAGIPPPKTPKERDTVLLALAQAGQGFFRELEAVATGQGGDPVLLSKFQKIMVQIQDVLARSTAAGAAGRQTQNIEPQTGISGQGNPALSAVREYNQR